MWQALKGQGREAQGVQLLTAAHRMGRRYHRIEVLGALASVLSTWLVTGILVVEAIDRVRNPVPVDGRRARPGNTGVEPGLSNVMQPLRCRTAAARVACWALCGPAA